MIAFRQGSRYPVFFWDGDLSSRLRGRRHQRCLQEIRVASWISPQVEDSPGYCWAKAVHHSKMGCVGFGSFASILPGPPCRPLSTIADITGRALGTNLDPLRTEGSGRPPHTG